MKAHVDTDNNLNYEVNGFLKKIFNLAYIPVLNYLPVSSKKMIKNSHKSVSDVIDNATNHDALEILYKKGDKKYSQNLLSKISHKIWFGTNNSKAVRNRLRLVKRELSSSLKSALNRKDHIFLLSIASGSARAVIESLHSLHIPEHKSVSVFFLDKNPMALEYSKGLLNEYNLSSNPRFKFEWINDNAGASLRKFDRNKLDIVEMVGLLDYFDDDKAVEIFSNIFNVLNGGGVFVTANINDNSERVFLTRVIGWPMIYRTCEQLGVLLLKAGFNKNNVRLFYEPLKIHGVAVAHKI